MKCPYCNAELSEESRFCYACGKPMPQKSKSAAETPDPAPIPAQPDSKPKSPKKPKKNRSLVIALSVLAGVLAVGIAMLVVFLLLHNASPKVSAEELAAAKEGFSPPAEVIEIDPSAADPSSDRIAFRYDERNRIIFCSYTLKDRQYEQTYTYDDENGEVEIVTTYKDNPIADATVSYDDVGYYGDVEVVDGYYIRLDEDSSDDLLRAKTGFVFNRNLVDYNGTVYYTDQSGLWINDGDTATRLYQCNSNHLATDGKTIYFSVFNQEKSAYSSSSRRTMKWNQYDIYSYDIKSGDCEKILSGNENPFPLCRIGDKLYFTDYQDDFDGFAVELSQSLYSYDLTTEEKTLLVADEAQPACIYGHKLFFTRIMGAPIPNNFKCYDIDEGTFEPVTSKTVLTESVAGDYLYYTAYDYESSSRNEKHTAYRRDLITGEETEILSEQGAYSRITYIDEDYITYYSGDRYDNVTHYLYDVKNDTTTAIAALSSVKNYVTFYRNGGEFVCWNEDELLIFPIDGSAPARTIPKNDKNSILAVCHDNIYYAGTTNYYFYNIYAVPLEPRSNDPTEPATE